MSCERRYRSLVTLILVPVVAVMWLPFVSSCNPQMLDLRKYIDEKTSNAALAPPANFHVIETTESAIQLGWDSVSNADGYYIYRSSSATGDYEKQAGGIESGWTDEGLAPSTTYYYKVCAYVGSGEGSRSESLAARTEAPMVPIPAAPANLHVTASSESTIQLAWDAVSGAEGYRLYRSDSTDGSYVKQDGDLTQPSYTDSGLTASTSYYYRVSAYNDAGEGEQSGSVSATTSAPPNHPPTVSVEPKNTTAAYGVKVTFTADAADSDGDGLSYRWYVDQVEQEGETAATFNVTKTPEVTTTYTIEVEVSDGQDAASDSTQLTVSGPAKLSYLEGGAWHSAIAPPPDTISACEQGSSLYALTRSGELYLLEGEVWRLYFPALPLGATAITGFDSTLYLLTSGGSLYLLDGMSWRAAEVTAPADAVAIAGSSSTLYALTQSAQLYYLDGGSWDLLSDAVPPNIVSVATCGTQLYVLASNGALYARDGGWGIQGVTAPSGAAEIFGAEGTLYALSY